jgi:hypothetical protein
MPGLRLIEGAAFDPETTRVMGVAWQHAMAGLAGVTCWPRCGETFNPIRGELGGLRSPKRAASMIRLATSSRTAAYLPLFLFVTRTREPQGRDRWAAVSALSFNGPPHATCVPLPLSYVLAIPSSELAELGSAVITMAMRIIIQSISWALCS